MSDEHTDRAHEDTRLGRLQRALLAWYDLQGRDLPWREPPEDGSGQTADARSRPGARCRPWAVLVSELMLQQTQAARVAARFPEFLGRFPDPATMAAAPVSAVIDAWQGLGYNRRAVNLHRAAQEMVWRHGGHLPRELDELEALPGVGPYTARAVAAFAYGQLRAPVDTNVARVMARAVAGAGLGRAEAQRVADGLVPVDRPADWSHALMDLGARYCTARRPVCGSCPVATQCAWRAAGWPDPDPARASSVRAGPQDAFAGSDRYCRGRIVDALRRAPLDASEVAATAGLEDAPERLERIVVGLVRDGLAVRDEHGGLCLPGRGG
ncbi:A/G-specific adenine glycosylase [Egibacter rhizosphaerae]|uniref:Adenine DNA glycosylase n=1 Tax=Egibacter rhizosphaerae TaxID=1670831 RepID=A0A411YDK4_9ACTN|nr:A/G-specific adenine glycosylase [Egibacter rhizosphaerae]QBI19268.1 A/G-specific adenine glycosylase [Egibacter rhizosphaerae]